MGSPQIYDDTLVAGDTYKLTLVYKDPTGNPIDVTGYKVDVSLRKSIEEEVPVIAKNYTIDATDGPLGLIYLKLEVAETALLIASCAANKATYVYDLQLTNVAGDEVQTLLGGFLEVSRGVTR